MKYRREVDGLRCIAVVPVILFHAGFDLFSGGFVGVDVFFVISGFLITGLILDEMEANRFSLIKFYERRARRILPALFLVSAACVPVAWALLSPADLQEFAQSLAALALFASNILFWRQSGYFDAEAELKPMLHTWSLAVEEQYYLLFPLLMIWCWRIGRIRLLYAIIAIGVASLTISEYQARTAPAAAFYLLPSRFWELLLGTMAAFVLRVWRAPLATLQSNKFAHEGVGVIGLLLILYSIFAFDDTTTFPGLHALVPTIGAVLILLFATEGTILCRLLSSAPLVGIGLISYSAYLWHQPLFAFARHASAGDVPKTWLVSLVALTFILSYFSWRFVEQPFRQQKKVQRRTVAIVSAAGLASLAVIGLVGHLMTPTITELRLAHSDSGVKGLFRTKQSLISERTTLIHRYAAVAESPFSEEQDKRKILILGDSVSNDLFISIQSNPESFHRIEVRRIKLDDLCMATFAKILAGGPVQHDSASLSCKESIEKVRGSSVFARAELIVLNAHWRMHTNRRGHQGAMLLAETLVSQGRQVAMVGILAMKEASSLAFLAIQRGMSVDETNRFAYNTVRRERISTPNADIRALAERNPRILYLDKYSLFCSDSVRSCNFFDTNSALLFSDSLHLSKDGARYFGERIADQNWFTSQASN